MSNRDENDHQQLHISSNTFHQQKRSILWYLSLCHISFVHSILERITLTPVNGGVILRSKGQRSRSLWATMYKSSKVD